MGILYSIDTPDPSLLKSEGPIVFAGWALDLDGASITGIAYVGGSTSQLSFVVPRPDVLRTLGLTGVDPVCGFGFTVDMAQYPGGVGVELEFASASESVRTTSFWLEHSGLRRVNYNEVWNALSGESEHDARMAVAGLADDKRFGEEAEKTKRTLLETVGISRTDVVLEIGCGVGRVGRVLAPLCREWVGADVSSNMLRHVSNHVQGASNVRTVLLNGYDLSPIESSSIDVAYCTVVFMHLDEWERYGYVREAWRVLRPSGRFYADNFNLCSGREMDPDIRVGNWCMPGPCRLASHPSRS